MLRIVNAKINLGLHILHRRPDGYHELSTLFYPIGLRSGTPYSPGPFGDILEITRSPHASDHSFHFSGNPIDCLQEKNLVVRALKLFEKNLHDKTKAILPPVELRLEKHIPDGAGLGGGSADASFTLSMLNELSERPFCEAELLQMATSLGADCPFFIFNRPAIASGIGEKLIPFPLDLSGFYLVVYKPPVSIPTAEAFAGIKPGLSTPESHQLLLAHPSEWASKMTNDFEKNIFSNHPELKELKNRLYMGGADYAQMSGSGSAVFGLFSSRSKAFDIWEETKKSREIFTALIRL